MTAFKNPDNGHVEKAGGALSWLWCFLFGPIYWAVKGVWRHAVANLAFAFLTVGLCQFVYVFFTYLILRNHYRKIGWQEVVAVIQTPSTQNLI